MEKEKTQTQVVIDSVKRVNDIDIDIPPFLKPVIKDGEEIGAVEKYIQEKRFEQIFNSRIIDRDNMVLNNLSVVENGVYMLSGDDSSNVHRYIEKPLFSVGQNLFSKNLEEKIYAAISVEKDFYEDLQLFKLEDFEIFTVPAFSSKFIEENGIEFNQRLNGIWKDSLNLVNVSLTSNSFYNLIKNNPKTKGLFSFKLGIYDPEFKNRWGVRVGKTQMEYLDLSDIISFEYVNESEILFYFTKENCKDEEGNLIVQVLRLDISKYQKAYFNLLERLINLSNNSKPSKQVQEIGLGLVEVDIDVDLDTI